MPRLLHSLLLGLVSLTFVGCADPYGGRVEVLGKVTLKGQPISDATVTFEPLDGQATRATAMVNDGSYAVDREHGLQPGKYLVRVSKGDAKTAINPVDADHPPGPGGGANIISKELVPADWNVNSKQERTVTPVSPNAIDLTIP